jgi:hypothetical protein
VWQTQSPRNQRWLHFRCCGQFVRNEDTSRVAADVAIRKRGYLQDARHDAFRFTESSIIYISVLDDDVEGRENPFHFFLTSL